ncbi:sugar O-acetyltransferase [Vibrio sp. WXL103]|uniref:sugar O-acetyltransferase n=1 Tax=unclassified Vibrio TaxID=2614977 RepID=UPI003EC75BB5
MQIIDIRMNALVSEKHLEEFSVHGSLERSLLDAQLTMREHLYDFNHTRPGETDKRQSLLTQILGRPCSTQIVPPLFCDIGTNLVLGEGGFINTNLVALDIAPIRIGNFVMIGPNVQLLASTHPLALQERLVPHIAGEPITIGDRVWIGAGAIILPGVNIGDNSVIGAGSVVNKDIPAGVLALGNPCRIIRAIDHGEIPSDEKIKANYAEFR